MSENSDDAAQPRGAADFSSVCAKTPAEDGSKRVALVLDFGTASDAPSGENPPAPRTACARVSPDATTADALAAVAGPCATTPTPCCAGSRATRSRGAGAGRAEGEGRLDGARRGPRPEGHGGRRRPSVGLYAGIAIVAALAGAATWRARRRRNATD
ncbi:hypothetical protein LV779_17850 [Streptomyces thinghirensis]|nr:hypothetical protein [Streptomyces thinghirensis]